MCMGEKKKGVPSPDQKVKSQTRADLAEVISMLVFIIPY